MIMAHACHHTIIPLNIPVEWYRRVVFILLKIKLCQVCKIHVLEI